jgi:hypothetical protein
MPGRRFRPRRGEQGSRISARDPCSSSQDRKDTLPGRDLPPRWGAALKRFHEEPFENQPTLPEQRQSGSVRVVIVKKRASDN